MKRLPELMAEEAAWDEPPKDAPIARQIRHAMFHGEQFTPDEVADQWDCNPSLLSQLVAQMRQGGWVVEGTGKPKRFAVTGRAETLPVVAPKAKRDSRRAHDVLMRPAPPTPALGTVLRVTALAEDDGGTAAIVLVGVDGKRWAAVVQ
jgi:hypothetical protein